METQRLLEEAIQANAGKEDLEFFQDPDLQTLKRTQTFDRRGKMSKEMSSKLSVWNF